MNNLLKFLDRRHSHDLSHTFKINGKSIKVEKTYFEDGTFEADLISSCDTYLHLDYNSNGDIVSYYEQGNCPVLDEIFDSLSIMF